MKKRKKRIKVKRRGLALIGKRTRNRRKKRKNPNFGANFGAGVASVAGAEDVVLAFANMVANTVNDILARMVTNKKTPPTIKSPKGLVDSLNVIQMYKDDKGNYGR